jgi:hypothetical protein
MRKLPKEKAWDRELPGLLSNRSLGHRWQAKPANDAPNISISRPWAGVQGVVLDGFQAL